MFGSVYLIVKDFNRSVEFYKKLFDKDVSSQNMDRFAIFNIDGLCLSIMNGYFDRDNPEKVEHKGTMYSEYDDMAAIVELTNSKKIVINLCTEDLNKEYRRICNLGIGSDITEIRYISAGHPYWYFSMKDPDENIIEITGEYN